MGIELLITPGCPAQGLAATRLRRGLDDIGLFGMDFTVRTITSMQDAEQAGFLGSPSILVDGLDLFPDPTAAPALTNRVYPTPRGTDGAPHPDQLRLALQLAFPLLGKPSVKVIGQT